MFSRRDKFQYFTFHPRLVLTYRFIAFTQTHLAITKLNSKHGSLLKHVRKCLKIENTNENKFTFLQERVFFLQFSFHFFFNAIKIFAIYYLLIFLKIFMNETENNLSCVDYVMLQTGLMEIYLTLNLIN